MVLLAAGAVIAAVVTAPQEHLDTSANDAHALRLLLDEKRLPTRDVSRIELRRAGEPVMVFERRERGWIQSAPIQCRLDSFSVQQLIDQAHAVRVVQPLDAARLPQGLSASTLSLDPPAASVLYQWTGGALTLECGRRGIGGRAYLRMAGDPTVFVVTQELHERAVEADPRDWRDRALFHEIGPETNRIEFSTSTERIVLERDRNEWLMRSPAATRADPQAIDELLAAIGRAPCSGFVLDHPTDLSRFGLEPPAGSLTVADAVGGAPRIQRLLVGATIGAGSEDRFGMTEGVDAVLRLGAPALRALFPSREKLAAATASGVSPADVKTIRISGPDGEFQLRRELERWVAPDFAGAEVPRQFPEELLDQLTSLRAAQVAFATYPHEQEVAFVTMHGYDGRPLTTVRIARDPKTGNWALENGDNVLRIHPSSLKLRLGPGDYGLQQPSR